MSWKRDLSSPTVGLTATRVNRSATLNGDWGWAAFTAENAFIMLNLLPSLADVDFDRECAREVGYK